MALQNLIRISLIKTAIFNVHYFGWASLLKPKVICARGVQLLKLQGKVDVRSEKIGAVRLGFGDVGILDRKKTTIFQNSGTIVFNGKADIGFGSAISCSGELEVGENFIISSSSSIMATKKVMIGDNCLFSWDCLLMDSDFHEIKSLQTGEVMNQSESIIIGDSVWLGCRCLILKGARISHDIVVAANSTVTRDLDESNSIYVSNQRNKTDIRWNF
ncbi:LbetaH domain-containing protein [Lactiplantibacillus plantarum]|uniref:DapH/DapD/GlmU-related protein n=1 Tax=Lactiplantibacillus plantarum TaxID=1590 RepID=UPI0032E4116B